MPGEATTATRMTAEEFFDWVHRPDNAGKWFELVRGEVLELPGTNDTTRRPRLQPRPVGGQLPV